MRSSIRRVDRTSRLARPVLVTLGVMNELSGVFDRLADALKASGASPSVTLRQQRAARPPRPHGPTEVFASRPIPVEHDARKEVDRSRDHAVYAAPHRPIRAHAHSRPDDIITERILRGAIATASEARRGVPVALIAFALTMLTGLGVLFLARY